MTPAAIALAVLCAVLAVVVAWQRATVRVTTERAESIEEIAKHDSRELRQRIGSDSALLAEAHALLHDERHKGKMDNQRQWQAARAEWAGKVNAR